MVHPVAAVANQTTRWRNGDLATSSSSSLSVAAHRVRHAPSAADRRSRARRGAVVLAWVFIYYGGGKLFGAFHGPVFTPVRSTSRTPRISIPASSSPSSLG